MARSEGGEYGVQPEFTRNRLRRLYSEPLNKNPAAA